MRPQYEDTLQATSAARREHVGARVDLKVVAADISKQLRLLDKVVRYRFGDNAELMGAWESARNVAGPFNTTNAPQRKRDLLGGAIFRNGNKYRFGKSAGPR